jgi:hypothetical protein
MRFFKHPAWLVLWTAAFSFLASMFGITEWYYLTSMDSAKAILGATVNIIGLALAVAGALYTGRRYMTRMARRVPGPRQ